MTTKLGQFILPNDVIARMRNKLIDTDRSNVEHGFDLCRKSGSNVLIDRGHCIGHECGINIKRICDPDEILEGDYHTHPVYGADPSFQDMITSYGLGIGCIGSVEDNDIKCYVRKDKTPDPTVISSIRNVIDRYEKPLEKMTYADILAGKGSDLEDKLFRAAHHFRDHYFKSISIE